MEALKRLYPARMLLTGNAFSRDGEFFDSHHTKRHIYAGVTVSVYDTPNFTGENGGAPGMPTEEDIEERKLDWGEDHPLYQGSVLARFPDMLDDSLLSRTAIESAVARWHGNNVPPTTPSSALGRGAPPASVVPAEAGTPPEPDAGRSPRHSRTPTRHSRENGNPECAGSAHGAGCGAGCDCGERGAAWQTDALDSRFHGNDGLYRHSRTSTRHSRTSGNPECAGSARGAGCGAGCDCLERGAAWQTDALDSRFHGNDEGEPYRLGVDVARFGSDKTALCVRHGWSVDYLRSFSRIDTMRTAGEAAALVRDHDIPAVFVDEGGLGAGVVDRLRELRAPVYGVQFGGKARQPGRFANMRAEIFWELRRLFNEGLIAIPPDEELISQLLGLRYDVTSAGQVRMESKSSLRRRGLRSPDKADALALAFMEPPSLQIWTAPPSSVVPAEAGTSPPRPVRDSTDFPSDSGALANRFGVW